MQRDPIVVSHRQCLKSTKIEAIRKEAERQGKFHMILNLGLIVFYRVTIEPPADAAGYRATASASSVERWSYNSSPIERHDMKIIQQRKLIQKNKN